MSNKLLLLFFFLLVLGSCGQDFNSNSNDKDQFSNVEIDISSPEGRRFSVAYKILQVKCMGCHDWALFTTSDKWIESGYVVRGNFSGSPLISILKNYGGNMPKDPYPALANSETTDLESWISNL